MKSFLAFLEKYDYIFTAISTIASFATLVGVIQFKKKYRLVTEKSQFSKNKSSYINELEGFVSSLTKDGLYSAELLTKIDVLLNDLKVNYSFFSLRLKINIKKTSHNIRKKYKTEAENNNTKNLDKLRIALQTIEGMIKKEEEHI